MWEGRPIKGERLLVAGISLRMNIYKQWEQVGRTLSMLKIKRDGLLED
jgi:hypothetical protein